MSYFALAAPPGIVSDDTTFASKGRWADGNNVRFYQGLPQTIGGNVNATSVIATFADVTKLLVYTVSGTTNIACAGQTLTRNVLDVSSTDITPAAWTGGGRHSLVMWGDVLLASNSGGKLFQSIAGARATHVTQAPANITTLLVTGTRQVMALGCNEVVSGTFNSRCIRISHTESLTDWTPSSSNLSDEVILEGQEPIVGATLLGEHVVVWTSGALYLGSFTGDPSQPWRFGKVADVGLVALDAFAVRGATAYFMAPDLRVYAYSIGQEPAQIPCPISREFMQDCGPEQRSNIFAFHNSKFGEVWFFYAGNGNSFPTSYIAFAVSETAAAQRPVWFKGLLGIDAIAEDPLLATPFSASETSLVTLQSTGGPYGLFRFDCAGAGGQGAQPFWHITTADQYFDESQKRVLIRSVLPDLEGNGPAATMHLYVRGRPHETPLEKGPLGLNYQTEKKGCRCSGKIVSVKFSAAGTDGFVRLGKPLFDVVPLGER
ncbi:hypothetical protein E2493_06225 [Sphingomonas parva]|uniref:Uncharacterized protein n=1 Tax=Sphingomonas parva TaxID=2555898 RepID=A0A4Y8ZSU7_9SPHN|nr:hypothetical protein [Sphingomonas parva]TFI59118.1 hypothetical protein E2493_06225 [Sphingomonas parva]